MRWHHCKHALLIAFAVALSSVAAPTAQQAPTPPPRSAGSAAASFTIFIRATPIGNEQITVSRSGDGWTITGSGRLNAPLDIASQRLQLRYDPNWVPLELTLDGVVRGKVFALRTTISGDTITDRITEGDQSSTESAMGRAEILLPHPFFAAPYEALAAKLKTAASGSTISVHSTPQDPFSIRVGDSSPDRFQTATQTIEARHTRIALVPVGAPPIDADVWGDSTGRLLRVSIPLQ